MNRAIISWTVVFLFLSLGAQAAPLNFVAIAPGYPGNTDQAQPSMDALARAVEVAADLKIGDVTFTYYEELEDGLARLDAGDVAGVMVPLSFFHRFATERSLSPVLEAIQENGEYDSWSLVALKGQIEVPTSLSGWVIAGKPGYAPDFVREVALADWGQLPKDVEIRFSPSIIRDIRKAARGESVAVLLDRFQTDSLGSLSMATELEVVTTSVELPASIFCWVGDSVEAAVRHRLEGALMALGDSALGREALGEVQLDGFENFDEREESLLQAMQGEIDD